MVLNRDDSPFKTIVLVAGEGEREFFYDKIQANQRWREIFSVVQSGVGCDFDEMQTPKVLLLMLSS